MMTVPARGTAAQIIEPNTEPTAPVVLSEGLALLQVIERASRDPAVDIDKMERLIAMRDRMVAQTARAAYAAALSGVQAKLPVIERKGLIKIPAKDGKTGHETPYALWEDINDAIRPLLSEHGFALSFRIKKDSDRVEVTGILSHREGHQEETTLSLPMDMTGSKNNVQAIGSSTSYGKRYTAAALLNLTSRLPEDRDDDGNAAGIKLITEEQRTEIQGLIEATGADIAKFCNHFKIDALPSLAAKDFDRAVQLLKAKAKRAQS